MSLDSNGSFSDLQSPSYKVLLSHANIFDHTTNCPLWFTFILHSHWCSSWFSNMIRFYICNFGTIYMLYRIVGIIHYLITIIHYDHAYMYYNHYKSYKCSPTGFPMQIYNSVSMFSIGILHPSEHSIIFIFLVMLN